MTAINAILPLVGTLVGAGITYWLNVRTRRHGRIEDLFNRAKEATAAAEVSADYLVDVGRPPHLSDSEYHDLQAWFVAEGIKNWVSRQDAANLALASVVPYRPEVEGFLPFRATKDRPQARAVLEILHRGPSS
jgi:hypothetical protein